MDGHLNVLIPHGMQDDASPSLTILVQLAPCGSCEFDTCLMSVKVLLSNNNVSAAA